MDITHEYLFPAGDIHIKRRNKWEKVSILITKNA